MARNEVEDFFGRLEQRHLNRPIELNLQQAEFFKHQDLDQADAIGELIKQEIGRLRFLNEYTAQVANTLRSNGIDILEEVDETKKNSAEPEAIKSPEPVEEEKKIPETLITPDGTELGGTTGKLLAFLAHEGTFKDRFESATYMYGSQDKAAAKKLNALITYVRKEESAAFKHGVRIETQLPSPKEKSQGVRAKDRAVFVEGPDAEPAVRIDQLAVSIPNKRKDVEPKVIALAQAGDHAAFAIIFKHYWNPIYNHVYRMMGNPEDAADFTQETFAKVYQAFPRTSYDLRVGAWIYKIATNVCLDELRHRQLIHWQPWDTFTSVFHPSQVSRDNPERDVLDKENQEEVQLILDRLNRRYRLSLILREYQDLFYDEIAEALNTTKSAVKTILFRAREQFRQVHARTERKPLLLDNAA